MNESEVLLPVQQLALSGRWTPPIRLLGEIWSSRELCGTLARKDFFVRYRRATFGMLWAVALPALQAVVLAVVLSRVTKISVPHYPVFIFSGIIGWTYFSTSLTAGATSIVDNSSLSSKIYFPRAILPLSVCLSNLFALGISMVILIIVAIISGVGLDWHTLYLLPAGLLAALFAMALTSVLSASHVYFRDIQYVVQAALLVWFYLTPVFYPLSFLHGAVRTLVDINPVTGIVQLYHATVQAHVDALASSVAVSLGWTAALLVAALVLHCRYDRSFADLL